ncbi:TlpA disulfide reductase family protein [Mucilaginibacter sp. UR6-11]|uniref:TlpA family protein disulfide reductase n=1 Tax=Mucilaginibacter sp. UR6-11 TaxID=1435644 RepID=UPI001E319B3E|nr:TlpA disulfide reductase family protein [Mucilaginibacter sp. UR6-11]MCC8424687.1 TlpA family protein disulfide reductase [Mucilaginibacter sp. UR6-11]
MKYISFLFLLLVFASCKHMQGDIEINGIAKGVTYGNVIIKDQANTNIFRADIEAGKFNIKSYLQYAGYYKMLYASKATKGGSREIEVYLEPGTYTIDINQDKINDYPLITSSSETQTQLSAYNNVRDSLRHEARQRAIAINNQMRGVNSDNGVKSMSDLDTLNKLQTAELKANQVDEMNVFNAFMAKYPDNEIAAHLLKALDYQNDPVGYYKLFQKFSPVARNSDDGKQLEVKLKELSKLAPGSPAPAITGTTPDGRELDIKAMKKKIFLLDFWRSSNGSSRDNHQQIITQLLQLKPKGFDVVSISFDTDKDKWLAAVKSDKMDWTQLSDLKGDDSPNGATWGIKSIPAYFLLDGGGKIIARIADFADVPAAVDEYMKKH